MMPAKHDPHIYRGDSKTIELTINRRYEQNGAWVVEPVNLTGHVFTSHMRTDVNSSGSPAAEFDCEVVDATAGRVDLYMSPEVTQTLAETTFVWDVQSVDPDNNVQTWVKGNVTVTFDVTRVV